MKKLLVATLLVFSLGLTACGGSGNETADNDKVEVNHEADQNESQDVTDVETETDSKAETEEVAQSDVIRYPDYVAPAELGSDVNTGAIEIEGKLYQFPIPTYLLLEDGFEITDLEKETFSKGDGGVYGTLKKNGITITDSIGFSCSLTNGSVGIEDSYVSALYIDAEVVPNVKFPGELSFPMKKDTIHTMAENAPYDVKLFGDACYRFPIAEYEVGYIDFDVDGDSIKRVCYMYTGANVPLGGVSGAKFDALEEAGGYVAPTEVGDDLTTLNFELEGEIYQFPMPLSELINDGWSLDESNALLQSLGGSLEPGARMDQYVEITKGDAVCLVKFANVTEETIPIEESTVWFLEVDVDSKVSSFHMAGGINLGTSKDVIEGMDFSPYVLNVGETQPYFIYSWGFENGTGATVWNGIDIYCSKETGAVECVRLIGSW